MKKLSNYKTLNDLISDKEILDMAKEHIDNNTVPYCPIGCGKSTLISRVTAGMMYLWEKGYECSREKMDK